MIATTVVLSCSARMLISALSRKATSVVAGVAGGLVHMADIGVALPEVDVLVPLMKQKTKTSVSPIAYIAVG